MKSLKLNATLNLLYQLFNMAFPLITSIYIARILLPDGAGRVSYAQNIASYFVSFAALGIPAHGMRAISVARDNQQKLNQTFTELLTINAVATAASLISYIVMVLSIPSFYQELPLYLCTGLLIAFNFLNIDWFYQGREDYVYIVCRNILVKLLSFLAIILLIRSKEHYVTYALIGSIASGGNYILNVCRARKYVSLQFKGMNLRQHLQPVFFLAITIFLSTIYSKVDTTMLGVISGDEAVGHYTYAHKIVNIAVALCTSICTTFLPRLSYYYENDRDAFKKLLNKGVQILSFVVFPMMIGVLILAPTVVVLLFGEAFMPTANTLRIFTGLMIVLPFGNLLCYQVLIVAKKEKIMIPVYAVAAVTNVLLNLLLIRRFAQDGAAVASVIAEAVLNGIEVTIVLKMLKIKLDLRAIGTAIFTALIMGVVVFLVASVKLPGWCTLLLGVSSGVVVYVALNLCMRTPLLMEGMQVVARWLKKRKGRE